LQKHLAEFADHLNGILTPSPTGQGNKKKTAARHTPKFDLGGELQRIMGVDLTRIDGIDVMVSQTLLSEVGVDMSRWKTEAHFASWLGL
jgi:transposase